MNTSFIKKLAPEGVGGERVPKTDVLKKPSSRQSRINEIFEKI